jgi:hypothetical protein
LGEGNGRSLCRAALIVLLSAHELSRLSELFVFLVAKISNEQSVIEFEQTMKGGDPMRLTEMVACSG